MTKIQLAGDALWKPELVLYNNADGNYEATYNANAIVYHDGTVEWTPPAVFHRSVVYPTIYIQIDCINQIRMNTR